MVTENLTTVVVTGRVATVENMFVVALAGLKTPVLLLPAPE